MYSSTVLGLVLDVIPEVCPSGILVSGGATSFGVRDRQEVPENRDSQNMAKKIEKNLCVQYLSTDTGTSTRDTVLIWRSTGIGTSSGGLISMPREKKKLPAYATVRSDVVLIIAQIS